MKKVSLLDLLHPDGNPGPSFVLGGNCPENLLPELSIPANQSIGLIILAPTPGECSAQGWLENAAEFIAQHLSDDGLCYLLLPPSWRLRTIDLLTRENLVIDSAFWHFPDWASSQYLVPLWQSLATFAVEEIISAPWWKRIPAKTIFRYEVTNKLLSAFWKPVGISVRRPGARSLFQWLFPQDQGTAIIRRSWRGSEGAEILYSFKHSDARPSAIVKITETSSACLDREAQVLELLGERVRASGAHVPDVLRTQELGGRSALFLSTVQGRPASDLLASEPDLLLPLLTKLVDWLTRWHVTTLQVRPMDAEQLPRASLMAIELFAPSLQNGEQYRHWLSAHLRAASESHFPFVATHNDLTMANVLMDDGLGIVDWETGTAQGWPLVDFYYAVTDAVRVAQRYPSWLDAFKACYQPGGAYSLNIQSWEQQLRSAAGVSRQFAELCFHACWLHHASNEQQVSRPGEARPFLEIVQWLALHCDTSQEIEITHV